MFNIFGNRKESEAKITSVIFAGQKSKSLCDNCSTVVDTTYKYHDVPVGKKIIPSVLVAVCNHCESVVKIPPDTEKEIDDFIASEAKEQSLLKSGSEFIEVKSRDDVDIDLSTEEEEVIKDESREDFMDAFPVEVLESVGKGNVSIITASNVSEEVFQDTMRKKKEIETTLWVNWIKTRNGLLIPCNEYIVISGKWDEKETRKESISELMNKVYDLSDSENVSLLMVQVVK